MYQTKSQEDTFALGQALGKVLCKGDTVLLSGNLGSGKSVLARGVARSFGVTGPMASPTFTLMQPYNGTENIYHFDLYRLSDIDEFYAAGLDEFIGGDGIALIEWPLEDLTEDFAGAPTLCISIDRDFSNTQDQTRRLDIVPRDFAGREQEILDALKPWEETL